MKRIYSRLIKKIKRSLQFQQSNEKERNAERLREEVESWKKYDKDACQITYEANLYQFSSSALSRFLQITSFINFS